MLQFMWVACAAVIFTAALRAKHSNRAARTGRLAVAVLYLAGGALVNAVFLATGEDYAEFADGAYIPFVRDTWRSLAVPNHDLFVTLLIVFEAAVGVLVLSGGKRTQLGLAAAVAFHVALLCFGWGFYLWSIPMIGALSLLLRAERQQDHVPVTVVMPHPTMRPTARGPGAASGGDEAFRVGAPSGPTAVDLYWLPLGAGGHSVRFNGIVYEAISSTIQRRPRCDVYHTALEIRMPNGLFAIEMTPIPNRRGWERGVVAEGAVGTRWAGRLRIFRYEIRRWCNGAIPDLRYAVASPIRITDDPSVAQRILELLPSVPTPTWGRDELQAGEMWSCNSIISWVLTRAGLDTDAIPLPTHGRAPGWDAGVAVARSRVPASVLGRAA
jgi:hypothetical protein